jgi:hypothetical protein
MSLTSTFANCLWTASNYLGSQQFRRALNHPLETQQELLIKYLVHNCECAYGQKYHFSEIKSYKEFNERVPLVSYEDLEPWIQRIVQGEDKVLTNDPVTHLIPTAGSNGPRKLIPFTLGLQKDMNRAIAPWISDLFLSYPSAATGPAYWSISPALQSKSTEASAVPIGFDDDSAYLGSMQKKLIEAAMAVPSAVRLINDIEIFQYVTLLCLLRKKDLSLISVWHPSFLSLLLDALPKNWNNLLRDIEYGSCKVSDLLPSNVIRALKLIPNPNRARELKMATSDKPEAIWPSLKIISCWGDGFAELALLELKKRFPKTCIQPKGLLATEAFVTIPYKNTFPLAIRSHFFEFLDLSGKVFLAHELIEGETYQVVATTAGGLWRYRMQDQVQVTGFLGQTPTLRFIGRIGNVSDQSGEKLSESFVAQIVQNKLLHLKSPPAFALLAPDQEKTGDIRYTFYIEGDESQIRLEELENELRTNPHYALCRDLGQLQKLRLFKIKSEGYETFTTREVAEGKRLGEIKPCFLSPKDNWSQKFKGNYVN